MGNFEFRLFNLSSRKWENKDNYLMSHDGKIYYKRYDGVVKYCRQDAFEVSYCIGCKDSKGVKAFTGDRILWLFNPATKTYNEGLIVWTEKGFMIEAQSKAYSIPDEFEIIGNKWDTVVKKDLVPEASTQSDGSGDGTVEEQEGDLAKVCRKCNGAREYPSGIACELTEDGVKSRVIFSPCQLCNPHGQAQ